MLVALVAASESFPCQLPPVSDLPFCNVSLQAATRAALLTSLMTTAELVTQMQNFATAIPRLGVETYNYWSEGLHGLMANTTSSRRSCRRGAIYAPFTALELCGAWSDRD